VRDTPGALWRPADLEAGVRREVIAVSSTQPQTGPGQQATTKSEPVEELVQRASQQLTELVRGELRLAQAEMREKGKRYGKGGGLFGGAGVVGFLMLQALVATVIAAVMALMGKKEVAQAAPPAPEQTIENVKADVAEIKESAKR
jgi:hypothetical protein